LAIVSVTHYDQFVILLFKQ